MDDRFVVSAVPTVCADDLTFPVLRVSTAAWTTDDIDVLAAALIRRTK